MENKTLIKIKDFECHYKDHKQPILSIPYLEIFTKRLTFILGTSGVGKTSLLQALGLMKNNFNANSRIEIHIDSRPSTYNQLWDSKEDLTRFRKEHFTFMFQESHFFSSFNIGDTLQLPHLILDNGHAKEDIDISNNRLFSELGLTRATSDMNKEVQKLSVGQKQRISFIQAMQKDRALLFADEPTGNVDLINSEKIIGLIQSRIHEANRLAAAIVVSHNVELALKYADDIVLLSLETAEKGTLKEENITRLVQEKTVEQKEDLKKTIRKVYEEDWTKSK